MLYAIWQHLNICNIDAGLDLTMDFPRDYKLLLTNPAQAERTSSRGPEAPAESGLWAQLPLPLGLEETSSPAADRSDRSALVQTLAVCVGGVNIAH